MAKLKTDLKHRIAESQKAYPILWADEPTVKAKRFQDLSCVLFGVKGIGKTPFLASIPGMYFIATEPGTNWQSVRASEVTTCATFKKFILDMEASPEKVATVRMWGIDTLDKLENMFMNNICYEWGLTSMSEEGFAGAWIELENQMDYWLKRLFAIGPGLIMTSHERDRDFEDGKITRSRVSLDLVRRSYKAVTDFADLGMHMRCVRQSGDVKDGRQPKRCIATYPSVYEDCWNRTGKVPAFIEFNTEAEAVKKIMASFDGDGDGDGDGEARPKFKRPVKKAGKPKWKR